MLRLLSRGLYTENVSCGSGTCCNRCLGLFHVWAVVDAGEHQVGERLAPVVIFMHIDNSSFLPIVSSAYSDTRAEECA